MSRRTRTALIGGVLVGALLIMGAGFPTTKVPPKHWATGVCTAIGDWVNASKTGADQLNTALTGTRPKLRDVRELLSGYLGSTAHATTLAIDGLNQAGTPTTPKGNTAARALTDSFKQIRSSLRHLQDTADGVSIKHKAKALKQLKSLNTDIGVEFSSFQKALTKLQHLDPNHKLRKAFQADAACQAL